MKQSTILFFQLSLLVTHIHDIRQSSAFAAKHTEISCPATISVKQSIIHEQGEWESYDENSSSVHPLTRASLFSGHPKFMAELRPTTGDSPTNKTERHEIYQFLETRSDGIYLACRYFNVSLIVTKKINPSPRECIVIRKREPTGVTIQAKCTDRAL